MVTNTDIVGDVAILPPLPKYKHCPVLVDLYIEVNDISNSVNARHWNKGNYAAINEELERNNWEFISEGQTIDQFNGTFLNVSKNLVALYVPLITREKEVVSGCKSRPPRSLMKPRSDAWKKNS